VLTQLAQQFLGTGAGQQAVQEVTSQTELDPGQAREAVQATAVGAAEAATGGGDDAQQGGGGLLGALGGGGLGALAGAALGGGNLSASLVDPVSKIVAQKTGIAPATAKMVVAIVLPKVMAYLQGGGDGPDQGGGEGGGAGGGLGGALGGLGGLLG
jgi:hypothetical protein